MFFAAQLTYLYVGIHIALLTTVHFALVFPPEDLLDGLGLTLFDLFTVLFDVEKYEFIEYICMRQSFFRAFVAFYPAGELFTWTQKNKEVKWFMRGSWQKLLRHVPKHRKTTERCGWESPGNTRTRNKPFLKMKQFSWEKIHFEWE